MKKSDLKDLAELIDQKITANNQVIFKEVFHKMDNMEENILTSVKAEVDRLDDRIDEVVVELKKKPDRYEVFEWTEKRIAQLKFN